MDSFIKVELVAALAVRYNLVTLLDFIKEHHIKTIQGAEDDYLILSDNTKMWVKQASKYTFIGTDDSINGLMSVEDFYRNRYAFMHNILAKNNGISDTITNLFDTFLQLVTEHQEPYNPVTTVFMQDHSEIYKTDASVKKQFIAHIDNVPGWIPFAIASENQDIISCRSAVNLLYDLKCCIDPSNDHELQQQLRLIQEAYPNEYNFNFTIQD